MAGLSHYYVDYGAGNDTTGDGSVGTPWKTIQKALDNAVEDDGVQVNIKAGTAQVLAASLDMTAYTVTNGVPASLDPLILRGYTSSANDGGIGEIDCGGNTMWADSGLDYIGLYELKIHNGGNNNLVGLDANIVVVKCELCAGASSPSGKFLLGFNNGLVAGCYLHDTGDGAAKGIHCGSAFVIGNHIVLDADAAAACGIKGCNSAYNIIVCQKTDQRAIEAPYSAYGNICYNTTAGATSAIRHAVSAFGAVTPLMNNIIVGWSGVGGIGIQVRAPSGYGHNAFYNCTTNTSYTYDFSGGLSTANDVALAANPFTDAGNGDFSLTAAAKTALADKGFPVSYYGAHANTTSNFNIGPIQNDAAAGGGSSNPLHGKLG